jgi:hypothetical protein
MFESKAISGTRMLLAGLLASSIFLAVAGAQTDRSAGKQAAAVTAAPAPPTATTAGTPYHYLPNRIPRRAGMYYESVWGVESLGVKLVESGEIVRFTYHVVDADKAKPLNNKKSEPVLIDPQTGVQLVVPTLDKVGQLRQSSTPEAGKSYWMGFSNKGRLVKRGDRVDVVIGQFKAQGLVVE